LQGGIKSPYKQIMNLFENEFEELEKALKIKLFLSKRLKIKWRKKLYDYLYSPHGSFLQEK